MTRFVLDVSVAAKWFLPEVHSEMALRLLDARYELHAPDFFFIEFLSILAKRIRRSELTVIESQDIRHSLQIFPIQFHPFRSLLDSAFEITSRTRQSIYDCLYLALAIRLGCLMITADRKFNNALKITSFNNYICWIEDLD